MRAFLYIVCFCVSDRVVEANVQFYPPISNLVTMEMYETTFILLTPLCTLRANVHLLIRLYFLRNILLFSQIGHLHDDVI